MRTLIYFTAIALTLVLFAAPAWSQKGCEAKNAQAFSPDPALYKQISIEQAVKMKNYIPADQYKASIKAEPAPKGNDRLLGKDKKK
jgi:hypothetical protein